MVKITIQEIHDKYGVAKDTIKHHFQKGKLPGRKIRVRWMAEETDVDDFYKSLYPREWLHIDYCTKHSPYSRTEILDAIDEGRLDSKENFWGMHIHYDKWNKNMAKNCCDNEKCAQIKEGFTGRVVNKCGIHNRPTALIGRILMNHPKVILYLCHKQRFHRLDRHDLALFLPSLMILKGDKVTFKAEGPKKEVKTVLYKIEELVKNGFYIYKKVSDDKLLALIA